MSAASTRVRKASGSAAGHGGGKAAIGRAARFGGGGGMESRTLERERGRREGMRGRR